MIILIYNRVTQVLQYDTSKSPLSSNPIIKIVYRKNLAQKVFMDNLHHAGTKINPDESVTKALFNKQSIILEKLTNSILAKFSFFQVKKWTLNARKFLILINNRGIFNENFNY